jgi:UDP-N-acetylmuramyl pentapeptide phosphotransferase/UDP-N-acetylglucosamine-1-phosphate transferase
VIFFNIPPSVLIIISLFSALLISYFSVPPIVKLARATKIKGLRDLPNGRTSHTNATPTLGGIAIFAGFIFPTLLISSYYETIPVLQFIAAGCLLIFFFGLRDDIFTISVYSKLFAQIMSAIILIGFAGIRLTNLHGFMGIYGINDYYSIILTIFVVVVIINAFNLIDGIDGLASAIGIVCAFTFGLWFYLSAQYQYAILSFALVGALLGFIHFNLFGTSFKIFMGDTGSLLIGFIIAILVIQFNELNLPSNLSVPSIYRIYSAPAVSISILMIPLYDTLRVFFVRIIRKQSPFKADRGHMHHKLIDLGYSHAKATLIMVIANIIFICIALFLQYMHIRILFLTLTLLVLGTFAFYIPVRMIHRRDKKILISEKKSDHPVSSF